jgi:hypothetical protein
MLVRSLALTLLLVVPSLAASLVERQGCSTCKPSGDTCSFYNCVESRYSCGPEGYPLGYGLKYCNGFQENLSSFSSKGVAWVKATRLCLQQSLVKSNCASSCDSLKSVAFDSHASCYVDSGVCTLSPSDWLAIEKTVGFTTLFGSWDALKEVIETASGCVGLWTWLLFH